MPAKHEARSTPYRVALLCDHRAPVWWVRQAAMGAQEVLRNALCWMRVVATHGGRRRGDAFLQWLRAQGIDGAVDLGHDWSMGASKPVAAWRFPLVCMPWIPSQIEADCIEIDESETARLMLEHLHALGHGSCAYLLTLDAPHARLRLAAFQREAQRLGMWAPQLLLDLRSPRTKSASVPLHLASPRKLAEFFDRQPKPMAVATHNDYVAAELIEWLRERGLRVPHDVAVLGVDNDALYALADGGLTTVDWRPHDMGREAALLLLARLEERAPPECRRVQLSPKLVVRHSTVAGGQSPQWLQTVLSAIRSQSHEPRLLERLAEELQCAESTVAERFHRAMGCTILDYRNRLRLEQAAHLLRATPDAKVAAIGRQVGFRKADWFAKLFKDYFGVGPAEYRRQLLSS